MGSKLFGIKTQGGVIAVTIALRARFLDETVDKAVKNFNKLTQSGCLEEYIDSFECCRSLLEMHSYDLSSKFVLESFVSGLKDNIKPFVKASQPHTIPQAYKNPSYQPNFSPQLQAKPPLLPNPMKPKLHQNFQQTLIETIGLFLLG